MTLGANDPYAVLAGKAPSVRTGRRPGVRLAGGAKGPQPAKPPDRTGMTEPEWAIYWAHGVLTPKRTEPEHFIFRANLGLLTSGKSEVDFLEVEERIVIDIQGFYYHFGLGGFTVLNDQVKRAILESAGYRYIAIDEHDAIRAPIEYLKWAIAGVERSIISRGGY